MATLSALLSRWGPECECFPLWSQASQFVLLLCVPHSDNSLYYATIFPTMWNEQRALYLTLWYHVDSGPRVCVLLAKTCGCLRSQLLTPERAESFSVEWVLTWGIWGMLAHRRVAHRLRSLVPWRELFSLFHMLLRLSWSEALLKNNPHASKPVRGWSLMCCILFSGSFHLASAPSSGVTWWLAPPSKPWLSHHRFTTQASNS